MYLIIDFGLTRTANKIKKKAWENSLADRSRFQRRHNRNSVDIIREGGFLGYNKAGKALWKGSKRVNRRDEIGLPTLTRKLRSGEYTPRTKVIKEMILDSKNYTDIRKVEDKALSKSGYMGYKNTPNSYFEESVPMEDMNIKVGKKTKFKHKQIYFTR